MKRVRAALLLSALTAILDTRAEAQLPPGLFLSVEVHPGVAVPVGDFANSGSGPGAGAGVGVGAGGALGVGPFAVYGEYQYARFGCQTCGEVGLDEQLVDLGWEAGAQLRVPVGLMGMRGLRPWLRAGVVGHQLQFSGLGEKASSDPALGFGVGGGVDVPLLGAGLVISPAIRFRSYRAEFDFEKLRTSDTDVSYLMLNLGVAYRF